MKRGVRDSGPRVKPTYLGALTLVNKVTWDHCYLDGLTGVSADNERESAASGRAGATRPVRTTLAWFGGLLVRFCGVGGIAVGFIGRVIDIYSLVVFAAVIVSWLNLPADNPVVKGLRAATDPLLEPIRKVVPDVAGLDFSPLILLLALQLAARLLTR